MKKVLKWIGIVLGSLLGLIILAALALVLRGNLIVNQVYSPPADNISIPTDAASLARGKHLVDMTCRGCHTPDLGGQAGWMDVAPLATIDSVNLTSGQGGIGQTFSDADYVRAIRHAVDPQGHGTLMVSVSAFQHFSDADLGDIVAYLRTAPPVDRTSRPKQFRPLGYILLALGKLPWPASIATHTTNISAPAEAPNAEYGKYFVDSTGCRDCHAENLNGGPYPQPGVTFTVPNLTPGGEVKSWTEAQFAQSIRTGITPSGRQLGDLMPWKDFKSASDLELQAVFTYLQSLPPLPQAPAQ